MTTTTKLTRGEILTGMEKGLFPVGTEFVAPYGDTFVVVDNGMRSTKLVDKITREAAQMKSFPSTTGWTQIIKPKFKVGDIIVNANAERLGTLSIGEVTKIEGHRVYASFANNNTNTHVAYQRTGIDWIHIDNVRHASNEESKLLPTLMLFKVAGRLPYEYKKGDIVKTAGGRLTFVLKVNQISESLELVYEENDPWVDITRSFTSVTPIQLSK